MNNILVSMLLVVRNAESYIEKSLYSLINQGFKKDEFEIIVIDGMSEDKTKEIAKNILEKENINYKIIDNPKLNLPSGWNLGINLANGEYIVRPDAHAELLDDYVKIGIEKLEKDSKLAAVGGVLITKSNTYIGKLIAKVLSNPIGVGTSLFRIGVKKDTISDTAVYAVYRKEILEKVGGFNENLTRNQDIDLHKRIQNLGFYFITTPDMRAIYYSRTNLKKFIKQAYENGFWVTYGKSGHFRHLIPLLFLITIFISIFISSKLFFLIMGIYLLAVAFAYIYKSKEKNIMNLIVLSILTFILHTFYGLGSLIGIIKRTKNAK